MTWYPGKNVERFLERRRGPDKPIEKPEEGKAAEYLKYNKDEIFKGLIAVEGHFRKVAKEKKLVEVGFLNCNVKHLADVEGHADEAISHSAVVEGEEEKSPQFSALSDAIRTFRWKLQEEGINPIEGVKGTRRLRRQFESFNPEYDVSKCKACEPIEILMKKALEQQKECEAQLQS